MMSNKLRGSDVNQKVLGVSPGFEHRTITGSRFPTYKQVLLCFLANKEKLRIEDVGLKKASLDSHLANFVVDQVASHYKKGGIVTTPLNKMAHKVMSLGVELREVKRRCNEKRIKEFRDKMEETMPFWTGKTMQEMEARSIDPLLKQEEKDKIKTDLKFLSSMMSDRLATYASVDGKTAVRERKRKFRQFGDEEKKKKEEGRVRKCVQEEAAAKATYYEFDEDKDTSKKAKIDEIYTPAKRSHKREVKTGTTYHFSPDFLMSKNLVSVQLRNKGVTPTAITAIATAIIKDNGGDPTAINLSFASTYRYREQSAAGISKKIKETWKPPSKAVVHWDGKKMQSLDGFEIKEKLPILVSGIGGIKMLGVPSLSGLSNGQAGEVISEATVKLLDDWNCRDKVIGMVFDTTSANTGSKTAACISLQTKLKRALLWLAFSASCWGGCRWPCLDGAGC